MIDILILTYNNMKTLNKCIKSIEENTDSKFKIYIFDNGSTDKEFLKELKSIKKKNIYIHFNDINVGVGPGRYYLSLMSNSELAFFLDSDMLVTPKWDIYIKKVMDKKSADVVGAVFRKGVSDIVQANGGYFKIEEEKFLNAKHFDEGKKISDELEIRKCDWLPGGALMITSEVNKKVKYLSNGYKVGFDDLDYSFQIMKSGFKMFSCPWTDFYHLNFEKDENYREVRKNKVEFLISAALFKKRWNLNPIRSWSVDKFLFKRRISKSEAEYIINWVIQNKEINKKDILNKIAQLRDKSYD